jgi:hypothetical protein
LKTYFSTVIFIAVTGFYWAFKCEILFKKLYCKIFDPRASLERFSVDAKHVSQ